MQQPPGSLLFSLQHRQGVGDMTSLTMTRLATALTMQVINQFFRAVNISFLPNPNFGSGSSSYTNIFAAFGFLILSDSFFDTLKMTFFVLSRVATFLRGLMPFFFKIS
jgi:hypothetical protein